MTVPGAIFADVTELSASFAVEIVPSPTVNCDESTHEAPSKY